MVMQPYELVINLKDLSCLCVSLVLLDALWAS